MMILPMVVLSRLPCLLSCRCELSSLSVERRTLEPLSNDSLRPICARKDGRRTFGFAASSPPASGEEDACSSALARWLPSLPRPPLFRPNDSFLPIFDRADFPAETICASKDSRRTRTFCFRSSPDEENVFAGLKSRRASAPVLSLPAPPPSDIVVVDTPLLFLGD